MADVSSPVLEGRRRFQCTAREWDRVALGAIALGACVRAVWILAVHPAVRFVYSDMLGYVERAARLASGAPLAPIDAFFPPGTHLLLAIPIALFGLVAGLWVATVLWCLLSIATVYVSWRLARILLTPAAAALTAAFCAVWPLFITYGGYFTSETPALAFLVTALWAGVEATRRDGRAALVLALAAGTLGGAAAATRPQLLINALILLAVALVSKKASVVSAAGLASALLVVIALVVAVNSVASGHLVGLARNGGVNFWLGHCDAKTVNTVNADNVLTYSITHPVASQLGRTGVIVVKNHDIWDEGLFVGLGLRCIEDDGIGHVARLGQNIIDMTATTTPWPQSADDGWPRTVVQVANLLYAVLLPLILVGSLFLLVRRRREGRGSGEAFLLANLLCVVVVAVLAIGDPRVRTVYDVFGFALLGALLAERLHLDRVPDDDALAER